MPIHTARPNGTVAAGSWTAVGAATLHAATSDDADGSYGRDFGPGFNAMTLDYSTPRTLLSNERVLRARMRVRGTCLESAGVAGDMNNEFGSAADGIIGFSAPIIDSGEALNTHTGVWHTFDDAGNEWDQTDLNGLRSEHEGRSGATTDVDARLMESYIQVDVRRRPVVQTVTAPDGDFFTRSPVVDFTASTVDGERQHNVQVRVFRLAAGQTAADIDPDVDGPVYDQTRDQEIQTFPLFTTLDPGDYVAFVRVSKLFAPDPSGEWFSEWEPSPVFSILEITTGALPVSEKPHRLGCGTHRVFLQERGGGAQLYSFPYERVSYGRVVDDMSIGDISLHPDAFDNPECVAGLVAANPWEHELSIWREQTEDGKTTRYEAWVGPLITPDVGERDATLSGRDLFAWFERRRLPTDRSLASEDLAQIFNLFATDALNQDDSPNIAIAPTNTGITGDREVFAADNRRAADELRELARNGLDFTMFGRTMLVGGEEVPTVDLGRIDTEAISEVRRRLDGLQAASETTVVGAGGGPDSAPIFARKLGDTSVIGLVQAIDSEQSILDTSSAQQAADTRQAFRDEGTPPFITGVLTEDAPVAHQDLIPGARATLAIDFHGRLITGSFRLRTVGFSDGSEGEVTAVEFIPIGTINA